RQGAPCAAGARLPERVCVVPVRSGTLVLFCAGHSLVTYRSGGTVTAGEMCRLRVLTSLNCERSCLTLEEVSGGRTRVGQKVGSPGDACIRTKNRHDLRRRCYRTCRNHIDRWFCPCRRR